MSETMRSFIAIEPSAAMRDALAGLIDTLGQASIQGLRVVRPAAIHLTLKFLGDIRVDQAESIVDSVSRSIHALQPFDLRIGSPGAFPNSRSPRVLWVGVDGDLSVLAALQDQMEGALATLGLAREDRPFSPHLTVGRFREGTPLPDRLRAAEALHSAAGSPEVGMHVSSISLMRSTLLPDGAVHKRVASISLEG
jgi:2'-5' RNA ligase